MATYYSPLYELAPNRGTAAYIPRYPNVDHRAVTVTELISIPAATFTSVLAAGDVIKLIPVLPAGVIVKDLIFTNGDMDSGTTITVNLGWTAAQTTFLSASTAFQSANTGTALTAAQIMGGVVSVAGDDLQFTVQAGPATSAAAIAVLVTLVYP
jgi:hypothetical protein